MADPDSVVDFLPVGKSLRMQRILEELDAELQAHLAQMDRRIMERLERILSDAEAHRLMGPFTAADGLDDLQACGRLVYYDEIQPDFVDEGARIEYLKSITTEEPPPRPPRRCPRPRRPERNAHDVERRAQHVRERRQQPTSRHPRQQPARVVAR